MSFLRIMAILFAIAFLAVGVAGFMPTYFQNGLLFGYFEVDTMHNSVHILSGLIALIAATNENYARGFFKVFGLIYAAIVVIAFWRDGNVYIMHVNMADNILHLVIAVFALYFGFIVSNNNRR